MINLEIFTEHYLLAALWATTDGDEGNLDDDGRGISDIVPEARERASKDCAAFITSNEKDLLEWEEARKTKDYSLEEMAGHDFFLTRCGHGVGFWDRGAGDVGDRLTRACEEVGEIWFYLGDDGKIYC